MPTDVYLGNVPTSPLDDADNIIFAEGINIRKVPYGDVKKDVIGEETLKTTAPKSKEAINELVQDLLESTGYGIVSGGVVSAQSTPNMTVQTTGCTLKTATGARQVVAANPTLAVTTADTTNPRKDIVYVDSTGVIQYLQGTASATPVAPTTPVGGNLLAEIYVTANATTITNANITDKRKILISTDLLATQLSERVKKSTVNITYYVNTSTGLDTNDGVTSGTAFKTVQKAIDSLPQVVNHTVNVNVSAGTYNEIVTISGFGGIGIINLNGGANNSEAVNYIINNLIVKRCSCGVTVTGITANSTTAVGFLSSSNTYVQLVSCVCTASTTSYAGITVTNGGVCYVTTCVINSRQYGISALTGSVVMSENNGGTGNTVGLYAQNAGTIGKYSAQPAGTTAESTIAGGVIR